MPGRRRITHGKQGGRGPSGAMFAPFDIAESKGHLDAAMLLSQADGSIREAMRAAGLLYDLEDVGKYVEESPTFGAIGMAVGPDLQIRLVGLIAAAMLVATQIEKLDA